MLLEIKRNKKGMMAVLLVLIIGATALILAMSASNLVINDTQNSFTNKKGEESYSIAEGCLEESFRHLRLDTSYTGETLNLGGGSCIISVTTSGNDRTITIVGTKDNYTQTIQADVTLVGNVITLNSRKDI